MTAVAFFQRAFPSCNAILLHGERPVLVDGGFGADTGSLLAWLEQQGVPAERLSLVVNTHWDCDHAGANHALAQFGIPIAAHAVEARAVNARDHGACRAAFLRQPVEPYRVDWLLQAGDQVDTGLVRWNVVDAPGHSPGQIGLHAPELGLLITGDAVHEADLGFIDPTCPGALDQAEATTARLAALPAICAYPGHGPVIADPPAALQRVTRRLAVWRQEPERMAWHAAKRILAYNLMLENGVAEADLPSYLLANPWFQAFAAIAFHQPPADLVGAIVTEMLRSGAASWQGGRLTAVTPHNPPPPGWARAPTEPAQWPP